MSYQCDLKSMNTIYMDHTAFFELSGDLAHVIHNVTAHTVVMTMKLKDCIHLCPVKVSKSVILSN